jgi:hypothetical protein
MAKTTLTDFDPANVGVGNTGRSLFEILRELQGLKFQVVTGGLANVNITTTGIKAADTLAAVIAIDGDNVTLASTVLNLTAEATIQADDAIRLSITNTQTYRLIVIWFGKAG